MKLQGIQQKMRQAERKLCDVSPEPHVLTTQPTAAPELRSESSVESSSTPAVVEPSATTTSSIPASTSAAQPFLEAMKTYAAQLQGLQLDLANLQIGDGLLVQVILQNINSSANSEVWNNQSTTNAANNGGAPQPARPESPLNAGLYRYLLILPPPHRLIAMTSLLFPPLPSTMKKPMQTSSSASVAIQNQLHSLHLPPDLLDAPIEAAKQLFDVFKGSVRDSPQAPREGAGGGSKDASKPTSPAVTKEGGEASTSEEFPAGDAASSTEASAVAEESQAESSTTASSSPSEAAASSTGVESAATDAPVTPAKSNATPSSNRSPSPVTPLTIPPPSGAATPADENVSISALLSPGNPSQPTAPTPMSARQMSVPPGAVEAQSSQQQKMRWYAIRSLDAISSIRPMDFRHDRAGGGGSMHRGFTINFHPHCAPGPSGLMDAITNRRDEDVLALWKQPWQCIIVDDQLKRVQGRFWQRVQRVEEENPTPITPPPAPTAAAAVVPPIVVASDSSPAVASSEATIVAPVPVKNETSPVLTEPTSPTPADVEPAPTSPSGAPIPVAQPVVEAAPAQQQQPQQQQGFFSSVMSIFTQRPVSTSATPPTNSDAPGSRKNTLASPAAPTQAQREAAAAASAAAELSYQVQQEVITSIHAASVGYFATLIDHEKTHIRNWLVDMKTAVSWDVPEHATLLRRLWDSWSPVLNPTSPIVGSGTATNPTSLPSLPFPGEVSEDWKLLGFQGTNPTTDFRGVGLLSLKVLVYLGERYPELIHVLMSLQSTSLMNPRQYPLACAGINLVCAVVNLLETSTPSPSSSSSSGASSSQGGNIAVVGGGRASVSQQPEQGQATQLLKDLTQTVSTAASKFLQKDDPSTTTPFLSPHQEALAAMFVRLGKNKLFRLFVRNKSRLGTKKTGGNGGTNATVHARRGSGISVPVNFTPASIVYLDSVHSMAELLVVLFPILDDQFVEQEAGYFQFNDVLRSVLSALEVTLLRKNPPDMRTLESAMKSHLRSVRAEREQAKAVQLAQEKARLEMILKRQASQSASSAPTPSPTAAPSPPAATAEKPDEPTAAATEASTAPAAAPSESTATKSSESTSTAPVDATSTAPPPVPAKRASGGTAGIGLIGFR